MSDNEETQGCCRSGSSSSNGPRCICLPYDDSYLIAAQVLSIVAFLLSWVWWVTFVVGLLAMVLLQVVWCCRPSRFLLIVTHVIALVATLACLFCGIYLLIEFRDEYWCDPFTLWRDGMSYMECQRTAYATVAFFDAALWLATAHCTIKFVISGRYAKWEAHWTGDDDDAEPTTDEERPAVAIATVEETESKAEA